MLQKEGERRSQQEKQELSLTGQMAKAKLARPLPISNRRENMLFKSEIFDIYSGKKAETENMQGVGWGKACLNCVKDNFPEGKKREGEEK